MNLNTAQVGYFIQQVGLAAASFGVSDGDIKLVATALGETFALSCSPPRTVIHSQGPQLQSICQANDCHKSSNATCDAYGQSEDPEVANATFAMGEGSNPGNKSVISTGPSGTAMGPKATGTAKSGESSLGNMVEASLDVLALAFLSVLAL